jgi:hypothetical protein
VELDAGALTAFLAARAGTDHSPAPTPDGRRRGAVEGGQDTGRLLAGPGKAAM